MKQKFLITGILTFTMLATLLPSCKKQDQPSNKIEINRSHVSKDMSRLWNPIVERCVGEPNYDCIKIGHISPWIQPYADVPAIFEDVFTYTGWQFDTHTDYDATETQAIADAYGITTTELNGLDGYGFFDLLFPEALTEGEFDDAVANFVANVYSDETEYRINIVFTPSSPLESLWAIEAEFEISEP